MDKQAVIAEFRAFANCDEATADFFLSSCNYDLQVTLKQAIELFLYTLLRLPCNNDLEIMLLQCYINN